MKRFTRASYRKHIDRTRSEWAFDQMISVVIPAYNEGAVIKRALNGITNGAHAGELDVIVVCNGCTDDTAQRTQQVGYPVRVIETTTSSKTNALNLGDAAAGPTFPRVYMDADVVMRIDHLRALANRLARGDILAAAPLARVVVDGCGLLARWYYDIAGLLPSARDGFGGSGAYALSREGRRRFGQFPNIIADDMYVQSNFKSHEYETVASATTTVFGPVRLRDILRIRISSKARPSSGSARISQPLARPSQQQQGHPRVVQTI